VTAAEVAGSRREAGAGSPVGPRAILALAALVVTLPACAPDDGSASGVARMNDPLPRLSGETLHGGSLDASSYAGGKVLVINVWAHDCPPCRAEQPMLVDLAHRYEDVRFLGINYDDDLDAARGWVREYAVPYPSLYDRPGRTAVDLGYPFIPDTYVVDRGGTIRWVVFGATDEAELSGLIEDVLG
jgi:cytochrome c biogenesis protein CcmG, thiol:disulfide interchange protein DsbE